MASYLGNNPDNIIKVRKANYRYVATSGQTVFSGTDSNSLSMSINTADVEVFLNGVLLDQTDYTVTASAVTLSAGATLSDIVEVITNTDFQVASLYTKEEVDSKVATAISDLVGTAGSALNTLGELSDALADDANYAATITTALGTKANSSDVTTALANKSNTSTTVTKDSSTGAATLPIGTTAQRPASPTVGMIRHNTTTGYPEWYSTETSSWVRFNQGIPYTAEYLVIAGGGGAAVYYSGGGGAGGLLSGSTTVTPSTDYPIIVGGGGAGSTNGFSSGSTGTSGTNSTGFSLTALGGGGGGSRSNGGSGGSGGGGGNNNTTGGSGTSGQGFGGGNGNGTGGASDIAAGGGGGATAAGVNGVYNSVRGVGGAGSNAFSTWATATSSGVSGYYAGGGGGGASGALGGSTTSGGAGGGGYGGAGSGTVAGQNGTANSGGGAGGGGENGDNTGAAGGSGIVIVRYVGTQKGNGGTITSSGGYTYHTFRSSSTFTA
jgi:hypothetical protein